MATNNSNSPAQDTNQTVTGSTGQDTLTGGLGDDVVVGGAGNDVLAGDGPVEGAWHYETFSHNFSSAAGQAFDFGADVSERTGSGYVTDFNESNLTNTINGTTGNPSDFGVIYTSTLNVTTGGTYDFSTTSDDGSTIQIFDSSGTPVTFLNQDGTTEAYLDNDFHQAATTRSGEVVLNSGETYTIQIRYWENAGQDSLSATVSGPDTGGVSEDLLTSDMLGLPPDPSFSTTGVPAGVEGDDTIYGGGGDDIISGNGGDDTLFGDEVGPGVPTNDLYDVSYYELSGGLSNLASAGFDASGNNSNVPTAEFLRDDLNVGAISLENGGDRETYAVRFETSLTVTNGGSYTFTTTSDDGSQLFVNGVRIVQNDGLHGSVTRSGSVTLGPGDHDIVIVFFENTGGDNLSATISGPDTGGSAIDLSTAAIVAPSATTVVNTPGNDTIDGGLGDDTIDAGGGDDIQTGGAGNDTFAEVSGDGADTITDFNAGNTGSITDGDQTNNDFVDLSGFYNATTLAAVNAAGGSFTTQLGLLKRDAADGQIDGIVDGIDYSAQIGDVDLTLLNGGTAVAPSDLTFDNTNVVCFAAGSRILTPDGPQPVETLDVGQLLPTARGVAQPIKWIGRQEFDANDLRENPKLRPVRIAAGTLGHDLPERDLYVSRQHRMVVSSKIAERICGNTDVLVPAIKLTVLPGIDVDNDCDSVMYLHVMLKNHEVIFAEQAPTESFFAGPEALKTLPERSKQQLRLLVPELRNQRCQSRPALKLLRKSDQKALVARHLKNNQPLLQAWG